MRVISVRARRTRKPNASVSFEDLYYICKDRVHYVAMPCSQFGYIISGVMNMVCCCVIFFSVYCICPEPTCND